MKSFLRQPSSRVTRFGCLLKSAWAERSGFVSLCGAMKPAHTEDAHAQFHFTDSVDAL